MSRMVRKQIYIEPRQEEILKRRAKEMRITEAELVRRAIDQINRSYASLPPQPAGMGRREGIHSEAPEHGRSSDRSKLDPRRAL